MAMYHENHPEGSYAMANKITLYQNLETTPMSTDP